MTSMDHDGHWFVASLPPASSARDGFVVGTLCFGVAAVCAVLVGQLL